MIMTLILKSLSYTIFSNFNSQIIENKIANYKAKNKGFIF